MNLYRGSGKPAEVQADLEKKAHPDAMLLCGNEVQLSLHEFFGRQLTRPDDWDGHSWEILYRCVTCGTVRRWGLE